MAPLTFSSGGGGGAAPDLGWRRLLLADATWTLDPHSQHGSLAEDANYSRWTSAAAITITTGDKEHMPNHGKIHGIELTDANGDSLRWDQPWACHFLIETISTRSALKNTKIYYGFGLTDATTDLENTNPCLGYATQWDSSSGSNYQKECMFRRDARSTGTFNEDWDIYGYFCRGPRYATQAGNFRIGRYKFDPGNTTGAGDTGDLQYASTPATTGTSGSVYAFATCGVVSTISSAVTADFRIWYSVTGAADWTP